MTLVRRFGFLALSLVAAVSMLSGCQKSSVIGIPPGPPQRLYVGNFLSSQVVAYARPLTPTSTASTTIIAPSLVDGVAADSAGNLYVPNGGVIYVYAQPITATTVPTAITVTGAIDFRGLNFDKAGNLWIADIAFPQVMELKPPFAGSPVAPLRTIQCACFSGPIEVATDIAGHIFVTNNGTGTVQVLNIPSATGLSVLAPVATLTSPTGSALGLASDVADRLFVTEDNSNLIMVYNPPFGTGNLPAFSLSAPTFTVPTCAVPPCSLVAPAQLHFDSTGNLYVAYQFDTTTVVTGGIAIFGAPISLSSSAQLLLQGAASGLTNPVDLTFTQ